MFLLLLSLFTDTGTFFAVGVDTYNLLILTSGKSKQNLTANRVECCL